MVTQKITMERIGEPFLFEAKNPAGHAARIDAGPAIGGTGQGMRPMELLLMGLAGCSGIDVVNILRKQRQVIRAMRVDVEGDRGEAEGSNPFEDIRVRFTLSGDIEETHLKRALELTFDKYCSAAKTLEKTAKISWEYTLNPSTSTESGGVSASAASDPKRVAGQVQQ